MASEYEKLRQQNIEDNKRVLAELGLLNPFKPLPKVIKKAPKRKRLIEPAKKEKKYIVTTSESKEENLEGYGSIQEGTRRRSSRIIGQAPLSDEQIEEQAKKWAEEDFIANEDGDGTPRRGSAIKRPNVYGAIPGVEIGTLWPMRLDCNAAGVHRPTVAGIHGGPMGAYSIVLSGGYEDNIDLGTCFTYTGEGGRDLKGTANNPKNLRTAPQSKDQKLSRGNAALVKSCETGMAVRVIRGFKLTSPFAPEDGYRYDGLYKVEKHWYTTGLAGFGVFKFALKRLDDQAPPPWTFEGDDKSIQGSQDSGVGSEVNSEVGSDTSSEKGENPEGVESPEKKSPKKEENTQIEQEQVKDNAESDKNENKDEENQTSADEKEIEETTVKDENNDNQEVLSEKSNTICQNSDADVSQNEISDSGVEKENKKEDSDKDDKVEKENKEVKKGRRKSKKDGLADEKTPQKNTLFKYFSKA